MSETARLAQPVNPVNSTVWKFALSAYDLLNTAMVDASMPRGAYAISCGPDTTEPDSRIAVWFYVPDQAADRAYYPMAIIATGEGAPDRKPFRFVGTVLLGDACQFAFHVFDLSTTDRR